MKRPTYKAKLFIAFFWMWCAIQVNTVNATPLDLSDVPLLIANSVEPNIFFTLDDSGSMQWEYIWDYTPSSSQRAPYYVFPRPNDVYGGSDYNNQVPTFADNNVHNFFARSSANNKIFYNPATTYLPWLNSDGTSMPNANPAAALYNPAIPAKGSLNLTAQQTQGASWFRHSSSLTSYSTTGSQTYWPITYYIYNGASTDPQGPRLVFGNYTKVQIQGNTLASGTITRSVAAEIQNFANWFTYYRSRILTARAGVGRAFAQQGTNMRVGFGAINENNTSIDGVTSSGTIVTGLRRFSGADRVNFFDNLYGYRLDAASTPLRRALDDVGRYFQRTDNRGPWGEVPGSNNTTAQLTCRQSFHILTTDGYWTDDSTSAAGTNAARQNVDNQNGLSISNPLGGSYQYTPVNPYKDGSSDTLADVAMYYWNRDLRTDLDNEVPTNSADPAFWQHLVNFTVGLGVTGTLDPATDLPDLIAGTKSWPSPNNDPRKIDDLWHAAVNSRGTFFSASDPDTFAQGLAGTLSAISDRVGAAASVATNSGSLQAGSKLYQGRFNSGDWSGQLLYYAIDTDPLSANFGGLLTTGPGPGGSILDAGQGIPAAASRSIITHNGTGGVPFRWASISATQQTAIGSAAVLDYLRGDSANEASNGGAYRNRLSKLGDVVDSAPIFVGPPNRRFPDIFGTGAPENVAPYSAFKALYANRNPVVYVGANDGMLHGFHADSGVELMAYVPASIYANLSSLSSPAYTHKFFVDGTPTERDVFFNNAWHTVLVGGMNNGARGIYALDITNSNVFSEGNAASIALWEFTNANDNDLGYTYSQPDIVRMHNGKWAAIFGNGYNSTSVNGDAVLFIVDIETGVLIKKITTETGIAEDPSGNGRPNGLATVSPVDLDGDFMIDVIYGGDLFGNMWKFDVSSSNPTQWKSAYGNASNPKPLFTACDDTACTNAQPITVKPRIGTHPTGDGVLVYFGTGQYLEISDNTVLAPASKQTYYSIWDNGAIVASRGSLLEQTIDFEGNATFTDPVSGATNTQPVRVTSANDIDWNVHNGWYLDLVVAGGSLEGERQVTSSVLRDGRIIFSTIIPGQDPCQGGGTSWLLELDADTGSRLELPPFDLNNDGNFSSSDNVIILVGGVPTSVAVSGLKSTTGLFSSPNVTTGTAGAPPGGSCVEKKTLNTSSGTPVTITESCGAASGRLSWRQLR